MLFGMGARRKFVYKPGGELLDAITFDLVRKWEVASESFEPSEYSVSIETKDSRTVLILEDEKAVWIEENGDRQALTYGKPVKLPRFENHPQSSLLRAIHSEILLNIMPFGPVPNLWIYPRPWYRDSALMLMCMKHTDNLHLVEEWVAGLQKVWDRNNSGEPEADNLGQCLYMISLFEDHNHPLIDKIMKTVPQYRRDNYIIGRSDYAEHPVYQTKWIKYGLKSLDMDDQFKIPEMYDSYSSLFWMDYRTQHVDGAKFGEEAVKNYPYLGWAEAHFYKTPPPMEVEMDVPPFTWEGAGSEAEYWRLIEPVKQGFYSEDDARRKFCCPHTWHAAEIFLYYTDPKMADISIGTVSEG